MEDLERRWVTQAGLMGCGRHGEEMGGTGWSNGLWKTWRGDG